MDLTFDSSKIIYLDNAATTFPKPREVLEQMCEGFRRFGVNPGRSGYDLCVVAGDLVLETRKELTRFFHGTDPLRLVFAQNATEALNIALLGILAPGDHAISTTLEHNSVIRPLNHLRRDHGVEVDFVPFDAGFRLDPADIAKRFRKNTKVVAVNHGSNVIGTVQPVAEVGRVCRERGIPLVLDVAQTAGMRKVDVEELGAAVVCFTGHKSLLGPMGTGGMYVREDVVIRQTRAGGTGVRSAQRHHLEEYPYRMEYGTPNLPGIAGLRAGVEWVLERGVENIHRQEMALWTQLRDGLRAIDGVTLHCQDSADDRIAVLSFNVDGLEAADTGTLLDVDYNIACRTGLHCAPMVHEHLGTDSIHGSVRFGIGPLNTAEHIATAVSAVREIAESRRKRR